MRPIESYNVLGGKLTPFTGRGKLYKWLADYHSSNGWVCVMMTIPDATHAVRCGVDLLLFKDQT